MNCLVTGGSRGIGFSIAKKLASEGYNVTLAARNKDLLYTRCAELPVCKESQVHNYWVLDMRDLNACLNFENSPCPPAKYHAFVNSAGVSVPQLLATQPLSTIQEVLNTNLYAPIVLSKTLCRHMLRSRDTERRHLIYISSILAAIGLPGSTIYSATKAGIEGFTKSLAKEVASKNIAVNCIAPGLAKTDMGENAFEAAAKLLNIKGFIDSADIAEQCATILKSRSVSGQIFTINQ